MSPAILLVAYSRSGGDAGQGESAGGDDGSDAAKDRCAEFFMVVPFG